MDGTVLGSAQRSMREKQLPYERRFRRWIDTEGMGWERVDLAVGPEGQFARGYRFSPAGHAVRRVLALHGAGNDALFGWLGLFSRLLHRGSEIFTFDLPGHGRLSRGRFSVQSALASVTGALDRLAARGSKLPVHAVGVSLGGSILLGCLPEVQDRLVSAAVVVAPLRIHLTPRSFLGEVRPHNLSIVVRERETYGLTGLIPSFGPFKRDLYPFRLSEPPPPGPFGYVESLNRALDDLRLEATAERIRLPVLLVYGDRDRIVPPTQGAELARRIPASQLETITGGTHLSTPLEPATNDRILQWIESRG